MDRFWTGHAKKDAQVALGLILKMGFFSNCLLHFDETSASYRTELDKLWKQKKTAEGFATKVRELGTITL